MSKKIWPARLIWAKRVWLTTLGLFLLLPMPILAGEGQDKKAVFLMKDNVVNGNYYAGGSTIEIYGEVNGDLYLAAQKVIIDSEKINGDVFIAAQNITIKGQINGSVRAAGDNLEISGQVRDNVLFFGQLINILPESKVSGHLSVWGAQVNHSGEVAGKVEGGIGLLAINGKVGGDVDVMLSGMGEGKSGLQISDGAIIGGQLKYKALKEGEISDKAQIAGGIDFSQITESPAHRFDMSYFWKLIVKFFMMLVLGMVLTYLLPKLMHKFYHETKVSPIKSMLWGLMFLIITPIACLILMFTFIGIPLALIVMILWAMSLYIAQIIAAWLAGNWLKEKMFKDKNWSAISILAFGIAVYIIVGQIPVLGWLVIMFLYLAAWGNVRQLFCK